MGNRKSTGRVFFVNRFYYPDLSATAQILTDVAEELAANRVPVVIVTSRNNYEGGKRFQKREDVNQVEIYRVWTTQFGRGTILGRLIDYLSFYFSATLFVLFRVRKDELVIAKTDPPMLSAFIGVATRIRKAKLINWLQDVFPEVAYRLSGTSTEGLFIRALKAIRNRSIKRAVATVVIGERMAKVITEVAPQRDSLKIIHNFVDDSAIQHSTEHSNALRGEWGIGANDFVVGYSGNLGRAHEYTTILDVATNLKDKPDIKFLFIGGGHLKDELSSQVKRRGLDNVIIKPYQSRSRLPESLALPNLHWASLAPALEGYIVPSKLYGIAAAGRPLLMIGDPKGEIGSLANRWDFGDCVLPGAVQGAQKFIESLHASPGDTAALGLNGRLFIENHGSRQRAIALWLELINRFRPNSRC